MADWLNERRANGEFITWEVNQAYTREAVLVDATLASVEPGTVLQYEAGKFCVIVNRVPKGRIAKTAAIVRGAAIVILDLLVFPTVVAVDGPDAGTDTVAETAAATAANRVAGLAYLASVGIIARN